MLKKFVLGLALCLAGLPALAGVQLYTNNAVTTLASNASSSTTSLSVASSTAFPSLSGGNWFIATLEHIVSSVVTAEEIVKVTAVSGTTWTVVRAQEGTAGVSWLSGDTVVLLPTAGGMANFIQPQSGTFTGTLTGMSGSTTGAVNYTVTGNVCTIYVTSGITGTSNSTALTLTGIPSACQPANTQAGTCGLVEDSGHALLGAVSITGGTASFSLAVTSDVSNRVDFVTSAFTASGTKGLPPGFLFMYTLN
jgi:hypothetical protein